MMTVKFDVCYLTNFQNADDQSIRNITLSAVFCGCET
jgi:hypothetical protein